MSRNCEAVDWGSTQWCSLNRHERCEYRIGWLSAGSPCRTSAGMDDGEQMVLEMGA